MYVYLFSKEKQTNVIIKNEYSIETCKKWINIAPMANLSTDNIYFYAIKQTVTSETWAKQFQFNSQWQLHSKNTDLLHQIVEYAKKIKDTSAAIAVLYYVAEKVPPGVELVYIAKCCYELSLKWIQNGNGQCNEKVKKLYEKNCCLNILYSHGLESLKDQVDNLPAILLEALYNHSSIITRAKCAMLNMPDINKAASEIADLYKFNIKSFRFELIEKLLYEPCHLNVVNDSFYPNQKVSEPSDDRVLRICYILQAEDIMIGANYLAKVGLCSETSADNGCEETFANLDDLTFSNLGASDSRASNTIKHRALQCLLACATQSIIANVTSMSFASLQ